MPLNGTGVMALETGLLAAYGAATINGQMGSNSSFTYTSLGTQFATAVIAYWHQAIVNTTITISPGLQDTASGKTTVPGLGTGLGIILPNTKQAAKFTANCIKTFRNAILAGQIDSNSDETINNLCADLSKHIYNYFTSTSVSTVVSALPEGPTVGATGPPALSVPVGVVVSPIVGTGEGEISFIGNFVSAVALAKGLSIAYSAAATTGQLSGNASIATTALASAIALAIHGYALTAIVKTDIDLPPGQTVVGYMSATVPPVPVLAATKGGNKVGSGLGKLT